MQTMTYAALAALLFVSPAESVELRCKIVGPNCLGALQVTLDEATRRVHIKADKQPGMAWDYKDGVTASVYVGEIPADAEIVTPVEQFVKIAPDRVELGFRGDDGEVLHLASFNRSALQGQPCFWHSLWNFGRS